MPQKTKSPIKAHPLRQAGESIRNEQIDLLFDKLLPVLTIVVFLWLLAGMVWTWSLNDVRPNPLFFTSLAVLVTAYVAMRVIPILRKLKNLKVGYRGERVVGEYLDRLRANGYRIYHDIPGDSGNMDHVIMSTRGIYTIETKTRRKPVRGQCVIRYDGNEISINGGARDASPIAH